MECSVYKNSLDFMDSFCELYLINEQFYQHQFLIDNIG